MFPLLLCPLFIFSRLFLPRDEIHGQQSFFDFWKTHARARDTRVDATVVTPGAKLSARKHSAARVPTFPRSRLRSPPLGVGRRTWRRLPWTTVQPTSGRNCFPNPSTSPSGGVRPTRMYLGLRLYRSYVDDVVAAAVNADDEKKRSLHAGKQQGAPWN